MTVEPTSLLDMDACREQVREAVHPFFRGRVDRVSGVMVEAIGVPAAVGELCRIRRRAGPTNGSTVPHVDVDAEVVGFRGQTTLLMPHGHLDGIAPMQAVIAQQRPFSVPVGEALLGRVLDGFGVPIDGLDALPALEHRSVRAEAPLPMERVPIDEPLQTGVRAIDGFTTLGRGQRIGIFAGSGVGKSSLLGQITRGTDAGVIIVCLVGERGREVRSFLDTVLGEEGRKRAIVVVATSDRPPIERYMAPFVALTIAEYFRDRGGDALVVMDSITRFAASAREIGLAAGEPPTVRGFPPSFFATVPKLVERMGRTKDGSITGILTVLLDADDPNDPVADTLRGLLDGHILLSRDLANRGHFPSIEVLGSLSRLATDLVDPQDTRRANHLRELLAVYNDGRDLVDIGAYKPGTNPRLDEALRLIPAINAFLQQESFDITDRQQTREMIDQICRASGFQEGTSA